jgi:3-methyladenine DNA glycosylase AlkD
MSSISALKKELHTLGNQEKAQNSARFFKTGEGQYGAGDIFLGVTVPEQRAIVKKYTDLSLTDIEQLLQSKEHEYRLSALMLLVNKYKKAGIKEQKQIFQLYLANTQWINNWDLVDSSAADIVGDYLRDKDKKILFTLACSRNLWEKRIAMIATFAYIKTGESTVALEIAEILINDTHDLIQKAVGWMLREVGKRCGQAQEEIFLKKHHKTMPRTTLRYALEHFSPQERKYYMGK